MSKKDSKDVKWLAASAATLFFLIIVYPEIDFESWRHIGIVIAVLLITWKFGVLFFRYVARGIVRDFVLCKSTWLHKMYDRKSWLTYPILNS